MNKSSRLKLHRELRICLLALSLAVPAFAVADSGSDTQLAEDIAAAPAMPEAQYGMAPSSIKIPATNASDSHKAESSHNFISTSDDAYDPIAEIATGTTDLWQRIRHNFALPQLDSPLVATHVSWYAERPDYLRRTIERSKLYLFHIMEEVQKRGMPAEIALLPIVESAFNPMAYSRSHASGIWQFIPSTGKHFGLKQNGWYDGRRDVVAATSAALDYLQKLHGMFGKWDLALAAYNCGEGCVSRAIAKNRAAGMPTDYLSLNLPTETRHYVPKLIAIKEIVVNPGVAGLVLDSIPNQAYFVPVSLQQSIDVKLAAQLADMPIKEFESLNPAFKKPLVRSDSNRRILLPVDKAEAFTTNLENYDRPLVSWQVYPAKKGERARDIARKFGVNLSWLKQHNEFKLTRQGRLTANHALMVPLAANQAQSEASARNGHAEVKHYTVRQGDTLFSIAKKFDIAVEDIQHWNHMQPQATIKTGASLILHPS